MTHDLMPAGPMDNKERDIIVKDRENPRALINLVPEPVQLAIERLPAKYVNKGEPELLVAYEYLGFQPDPNDHRLRHMFWKEYERAQLQNDKMWMPHVYKGICTRDYFYVVLQSRERTAWLVCPPVDYLVQTEESLNFGLAQLRDILSLRHTTISGAIDAKAAGVKLEIIKLLDMRVKGAVIQTMRNVNVNVNANKKIEASIRTTPEDIDKRIKELEDSLKQIGASPKGNDYDDAEVSVEP